MIKRGLAVALSIAAGASAQTCDHRLTRTPVGPVAVYRNGVLQRQSDASKSEVGDYDQVPNPPSSMPTIKPKSWSNNDYMSAVFSRATPLLLTLPTKETLTYWGYQLFREDWNCAGDSAKLDSTTRVGERQLLVKELRVEGAGPFRFFITLGPAPTSTASSDGEVYPLLIFADQADGKLKILKQDGSIVLLDK